MPLNAEHAIDGVNEEEAICGGLITKVIRKFFKQLYVGRVATGLPRGLSRTAACIDLRQLFIWGGALSSVRVFGPSQSLHFVKHLDPSTNRCVAFRKTVNSLRILALHDSLRSLAQ